MRGLEHIAKLISDTRDVPAAARDLAGLALVDFVACAVAGAREPIAQLVMRQCGEAHAGDAATVIGRPARARPIEAAFANGTAAHALDFDDSNMVLGGHPSVVLFPGLLALGEMRGRSGRDVLDAYVIGFEVLLAFAQAVNFEHYEKGWHPTATLGTFGAAAAAAKLLRLDAPQCAAAIGLAASMCSGLKASFGTMAKPLQVGEASRRGVMCALLASDGCTASRGALEAKQGFFAVYNGEGRYRDDALQKAGDGFELLRSGIEFKKYACCGSTHAPIDATLAIRRRYGLAPADVETVRVAMNARRRPHVDRPEVDDELAAKFSLQFVVAAALADGEVVLGHFTADQIRRSDLRELMQRVELAALPGGDAALAQGCEVTIRTKSGESFSLRLEDAEGRSADAYRGYMEQKFNDCVRHRFDASEARELLAALVSFDGCTNVEAVVSRLAGAEGMIRGTMQ